MDRRELLKNIAAITAVAATPIIVKGEEVAKKIEIDSDSKYIVLVAEHVRHEFVDQLCESSTLPAGTPIYVVRDIDDTMRIFKL